ncbi:MAG: leucyl aminopeptidase [Pseudomonadota bacterium]|nr:leucyl aminopeptidase [Pseudomonadota bacterium]QKK05543.1 MAG: leucyl aminopeptidase [Pseudomonadota bacterium]
MKVTFSSTQSDKRDAVVVTSLSSAKLRNAAVALDTKTGGALTRAVRATGFKGNAGQNISISGPANEDAKHVVIAGLGKSAELDGKKLQANGKSLTAIFNQNGVKKVDVELDSVRGTKAADMAAEMALGATLESYSFDKYKTGAKKKDERVLNFVVDDPAAAEKAFEKLSATAKGVFLTKDLSNEPPNVLYPESFADRVVDEFKGSNVTVRVLDEAEMEKLGMGALLGVGQGSERPSRLVVMEYNGAPDTASDDEKRPVAFVGKGITFDTGGISLKSGGGRTMKYDMCGAAAVVGAMKTLSERGAGSNVVGVIALAENMPSGSAQRPDDVVTSMSGKTVEIVNTDAEGRLVLIDALTYVQQKHDPKVVVDLATLTGAIISALGSEHAGLFTNSDSLSDKLLEAGTKTDEKLWRMPVGGAYADGLKSNIADLMHMGGKAGSSSAASFLEKFIDDGREWAHLDIAGTAFSSEATGYGVRLLDQFVAENYETQKAKPKRTAQSSLKK